MKQEEAIKKLKYMKICYEEEIGQCSGLSDAEWIEHVDMCNVAIQSLEKQIPKKPIKLPQEETFYDGGYHDHKCKICDIPLNKNMVYCDKCGNKIDWGNEK